MKQLRIGIIGGTFNPIHNGHLEIAKAAKSYLNLDKVIFVPSGTSYMKTHVLDTQMRYFMTECAVEDQPSFFVSDIETKREGNSYTYKTLQILKEQNPSIEYYFIMGADSLYALETWYKPDIICKLSTLVCAVRDHVTMSDLQLQAAHLKEKFQAKIEILPVDYIDISSTEIRSMVQKNQDITAYVPKAVAAFIRDNHLYQK